MCLPAYLLAPVFHQSEFDPQAVSSPAFPGCHIQQLWQPLQKPDSTPYRAVFHSSPEERGEVTQHSPPSDWSAPGTRTTQTAAEVEAESEQVAEGPGDIGVE